MIYPFILGISLWLAFPPHAISYLVFISMSLFVYGLNRRKSGFWYGYIFYLGAVTAFIGYWFSYYFRLQLGTGYLLSYALTSIICFYTALYIGIIGYIYSRIKTRSQFFNLVFLFPSLWVLTELLRGFFFPRSWYALGNTQVDNYLFHGYYALFGVYFVSWLVVAIGGYLTYLFSKYRFSFSVIRLIVTSLIFIAISYTISSIRYTKPYGKPIKVALLQPSIFSTTNFTYDKQMTIENISKQLVENISADLLVLPETVFGTDYHYLGFGTINILKTITDEKHERLIFGSPIHWPNTLHQTGIIDITHLDTPIYFKHYLVPFGEYNPLKDTFLDPFLYSIGFRLNDYIPGNYIQPPTSMLGQKFAFNTCYENTINDYVATNAKDATILLNQSDLSWYGQTKMKDVSLQFSQSRALENQRYFLQDGNTGDTVIINPQGVVEKRLPAFTSGALIGEVQGYSGTTPFERWNNIPIWLICCSCTMLALILKTFSFHKNKYNKE